MKDLKIVDEKSEVENLTVSHSERDDIGEEPITEGCFKLATLHIIIVIVVVVVIS